MKNNEDILIEHLKGIINGLIDSIPSIKNYTEEMTNSYIEYTKNYTDNIITDYNLIKETIPEKYVNFYLNKYGINLVKKEEIEEFMDLCKKYTILQEKFKDIDTTFPIFTADYIINHFNLNEIQHN